ncbi:MAG: PEP-CTERM sorting domain-containing protein [Planctomycetota bacterium]
MSMFFSVSSHANLLSNGSFESPVTSSKIFGFDSSPDIPGWVEDAGGVYLDSGVEDDLASAPDGTRLAFLKNDDDGFFQTTSHVISLSDSFSLEFDVLATFLANSIDVSIFYADPSNILVSETLAITSTSWETLSITTTGITLPAAAIGTQVGVRFDNQSYPTVDGITYLAIDDVSLTVVPEPASVLLLGSLALLATSRKRR